ncbi:MAG: hypothetical protein IJ991_10340 [Thermoguttaceae bacterium]|nr:hypothetical protein [Thermoguttaceae bacterium]
MKGNASNVRALFERSQRAAEKVLAATTERQAKEALWTWRRMFEKAGKRRTLKRAKPRENPYEVWDVRAGGLRRLGTVKEFKKAVKRDRRKGTGFRGRDVGALSRLRERRFDAKVDALKNKRLAEDPEFVASGASFDSDFARKKKKKLKSVAWLDVALKDGFDGYVKDASSAPGDWPITWKRPAAAGKHGVQDYYLRSAMKLRKIDATRWELTIKPFFTTGYGKEILRVLERGGTIRKPRRRKLVGYTVVYYRLSSVGKSSRRQKRLEGRGVQVRYRGAERRKIAPRYITPQSAFAIAARPFLQALKERVDENALKELPKGD